MAEASGSPAKTKKRPVDDGGAPPKRTKFPGVRVLHGRIYDPDHGKTCHQCRQKTMDLSATCTNQGGKRPCTVHICHKCLLNRYGEIAEEAVSADDWRCPKCRGICNCSFCMKKKGHKPTGALIRAARATGLSSASELIQVKGAENLDAYKAVVLPKKLASPRKFNALKRKRKSKFVSSSEMGSWEDSFDASEDLSLNLTDSSPISIAKIRKRVKREGVEYLYCPQIPEGKDRKTKSKGFVSDNDSSSPIKPDNAEKIYNGYSQVVEKNDDDGDNNADSESTASVKHQGFKKYEMNLDREEIEFDLSVSKVNFLRTALGIDLSTEDIGHALQFLEFCASFGKACKTPMDQTGSKEKMGNAATSCSETAFISSCLRSPSPTH